MYDEMEGLHTHACMCSGMGTGGLSAIFTTGGLSAIFTTGGLSAILTTRTCMHV